MSPLQAILLGIIQGITEFLPISSSGHLVLFQHILGLKEPALFFDISVHMGTLIAVIIFFRQEIRDIFISLIRLSNSVFNKKVSFNQIQEDTSLNLILMIIIGSIPTAIIGLSLNKAAEQIFSSVLIVGWMLIITGLLLFATRWIKESRKNNILIKDALIIGVVQGIAIMPGISRSGSTISAGLFLGLSREVAARYSFLLSIPAIFGAQLLSLKDISDPAVSVSVTFLGVVFAFITGYGSLKLLLFIINRGQLHYFAPYCWIVGIIAIIAG